ncbi:MAG: DUF2236 domain-containing protein [Candidatus Rokubacteria bacterium]|nr:DUF2236 domain-containing protein [Candidatus Rokubacteria bacterium]
MSWRLHREVVLLAGWGRAILLQIAHPLVARGVAEHSTFLREPRERWQRLARTLRAMLALTFGTEEERQQAAAGIRHIHARVNGLLPEAAGRFSPGTAYTAEDPALLGWVHATLVDSFLLTYELFVGPLGRADRDRYCVEAAGIEPLLGIPPGVLPRSMPALRTSMEEMLASGAIAVTPTARELASAIVTPPVPLIARPLLPLLRLPTVGLLPSAIRAAYGFPWDARRDRALRLSAAIVRRLLPLCPSLIRHWPAARAAYARARRGPAPGEAGAA